MEAHLINNYDEESAPWGNTVRDAWQWVDERPYVAGTFVWTGFDYRGEPTPFEWPSVSTFFGTYDSCGFAKDACYLYKAFWREEPMVHLLPHWNLEVEEASLVKVMAFTNCDEVELILNGESIERKKSKKYEQVNFKVPYQTGTLKAVAYNNGEKAAEDEVVTAGKAVELRAELSKETINNDGHDAFAINVFAIDSNGVRVPDADNLVSFEVEGGAKIIGVGNGDPNSHEPDLASYRKLYNGYAQAILRNTGNEEIRVKLKADTLRSAEVEINVREREHIPYIQAVDEEVIQAWKMHYRLFDEMPNPNPRVENNDMNTFEPLAITGKTQPQFSGQYLKYGLYRVLLNTGRKGSKRNLYFPSIKGKSWVYLDGEKIAEKMSDGQLSIDLAKDLEGEHVLTVVVQNVDKNFPEAGICAPVTLKNY
ncbi:DUF4982 domain-containing protein [Natronospora cellulosivora (SeqCode)]